MHRTLSKKHISLHKQSNLDEELGSIQHAQLTADNILDKLLRPNQSDKKASQHQKYRPKFEKRDNETLSKQNLSLKQELKTQRQAVAQLKFRLSEAERKVKFLQNIQEKWEQSVQENHDGKRLEVYTEILKKKIQELNELYLSSEEKITELKKLPHISVFDEHTIEMQHLQRETVRLKAIIASFPHPQPQDDNLQNKLLKLMKEENEKLKATIRLFQNDKNLLKSRQTIQKRQIADLKKDIEDLRRKLTIREAELQKAQNETKNILLKKAFQLRTQQEKKESDEVARLKSIIDQNRIEIQRLEAEKEQLAVETQKLKENEKILQNKQSIEDKQKNDLRAENSRLRRLVQEIRADLEREKENYRIMEQHSKKRRIQSAKPIAPPPKIQRMAPVKFEEIELGLLTIISALESGTLTSLLQVIPDEGDLRCGRLVQYLGDEPVSLYRTQAIKLIRYLTETEGKRATKFNEREEVNRQLSLTILKAAINRLLECRTSQNQDIWRCLLAKAKKLIPELEKFKGTAISKATFLDILSRHLNSSFGPYVQLAVLQSYDQEQSEVEIMLNADSLLQMFERIASNIPLKAAQY